MHTYMCIVESIKSENNENKSYAGICASLLDVFAASPSGTDTTQSSQFV